EVEAVVRDRDDVAEAASLADRPAQPVREVDAAVDGQRRGRARPGARFVLGRRDHRLRPCQRGQREPSRRRRQHVLTFRLLGYVAGIFYSQALHYLDLVETVNMALPDFLLAGAPKAGTTALHVALAAHPQ